MPLYEKNEIAKCGRRYSTLDSIPRIDRNKIELYGYDMESALQNILHSSLSNVVDMSWTEHYIHNKLSVRLELVELFNLPIEDVKMEITAIYQGRYFNSKKYPIHQYLEDLFKEVVDIRAYLFENHWKKSQDELEVYKYARRRTKDKYPNRASVRQLQVTFLFFCWTYFERKIQNIMCKYIPNPLPLHDAVYSQSNELPPKDFLEAKILEETQIPMKLGVG